jgi:hypothetical protein
MKQYEAINQINQSARTNNNSWHPAAETSEFEPIPLAESHTIAIELVPHAEFGQDDTAIIAATTNISRFSAVRERVERMNGMTVLQAIELNIYTLRTLRSDESAGYIALVRTSDSSARDTDGDDLRSAEIWMDCDDHLFYVKSDGRLSLQTATDSFARQTAGSYPKAGSALRGCVAFI